MTITALSMQVFSAASKGETWAEKLNVISVVGSVLLVLALWITGEAAWSVVRRRQAA